MQHFSAALFRSTTFNSCASSVLEIFSRIESFYMVYLRVGGGTYVWALVAKQQVAQLPMCVLTVPVAGWAWSPWSQRTPGCPGLLWASRSEGRTLLRLLIICANYAQVLLLTCHWFASAGIQRSPWQQGKWLGQKYFFDGVEVGVWLCDRHLHCVGLLQGEIGEDGLDGVDGEQVGLPSAQHIVNQLLLRSWPLFWYPPVHLKGNTGTDGIRGERGRSGNPVINLTFSLLWGTWPLNCGPLTSSLNTVLSSGSPGNQRGSGA